jgi:imidazolonepropionase
LVTPGLVDPHTHALYGGDRAHEVALKLAGVPYLEILARGGGILSTVRATREATDAELYESTARRLGAMLAMGTTTVEIKSGYGLSVEEELRALRIIRRLDRHLSISIVPTFLGAHAVPEESRSDPEGYVDAIVEQMIPAVADEGLSGFCDVFCEAGVFSVEQSRRILDAGNARGLRGKVHADEIEPMGGAQLAADCGAVSADHLRATTGDGMTRLAESGVVPVVLPATSFNLRGHHYANARRMIDEFELPVALATDDNPGTSPTESLQLVMTLAALELRMTPEEILAGVTINAARAIGVEEKAGSLEAGKGGDLVIWQAFDLAMLPYRFGTNQAAMVLKAGDVVAGGLRH